MATLKQDKPWYRYYGPWMLMLGPAVVVVAGIITAWLAVKYEDGLVTDDYYKRGKEINMDFARDQEATRLGLNSNLMLGDDDQDIRLMLTGNTDLATVRDLTLRLMHPTVQGRDQTLVLQALGNSLYQGKLQNALQGRWYVSLDAPSQKWRLTGEWNSDKDKAIILKAAAKR